MWIEYDRERDVLYIRLDATQSQFRNALFSEDEFDVVFDTDGDDRIAGIEILDAAKRVNLKELLAVEVRDAAPASV
ncbi:MAG: DUF2283 domain-containing protein [Tepidiformaceae bacterium]